MDLVILKKKIDGYRAANGSIKNVPPELLLELRQTWEHFTGSQDQFRSELGIRSGTLRNLLVESRKLNHVIGSTGALGVMIEGTEGTGNNSETGLQPPPTRGQETKLMLELAFDHGSKVIRFPDVETLVDFLRRTA